VPLSRGKIKRVYGTWTSRLTEFIGGLLVALWEEGPTLFRQDLVFSVLFSKGAKLLVEMRARRHAED